MQLTRITATLGAVALGGLLVASTTSVGASASVDHQRPAHARTVVVHDHFVAPAPHGFRPNSNLRMGLHCDSADMSM
jgi:hypothetical protein